MQDGGSPAVEPARDSKPRMELGVDVHQSAIEQ